MAFIMMKYISYMSNLLKSFYRKWMLKFVNCFFCVYWDKHMILSFY